MFRTIAEIEATIARGGLSEVDQYDLWDCLYLSPTEIGQLLQIVRDLATDSVSILLHAIPAYTGMRRGEVLRLLWSDLDPDHRVIIARAATVAYQEGDRATDRHASGTGRELAACASSGRRANS